MPDGFIDAPLSAATGAVAAGALAVSLRGARRELDERTAPLAGLVAAFRCCRAGAARSPSRPSPPPCSPSRPPPSPSP
ncbi:energy-coupling factor ABC transporter permease [Streptomyces sp. NPDC005526]|uniref:energy-coupling factor ABC transporter permease n=1 Tax=Streptomyces sp. NPDC005526 TaxID=3156885 RepID=UPI0033A8E6DB